MNTAQTKALREIATRTTPYAFTLHFTREFTRGNLVGLTHIDSIGFCRSADCDEWVSIINQKNAAGTIDYKVISWRVVQS